METQGISSNRMQASLSKIESKHGDITGLSYSDRKTAQQIKKRALKRVVNTKVRLNEANESGDSKLANQLKTKLKKAKKRLNTILEKIYTKPETPAEAPIANPVDTPTVSTDSGSAVNNEPSTTPTVSDPLTIESQNVFDKFQSSLESLSQSYQNSENALNEAIESGDVFALAKARIEHQKSQLSLTSINEIIQSRVQNMNRWIQGLFVR